MNRECTQMGDHDFRDVIPTRELPARRTHRMRVRAARGALRRTGKAETVRTDGPAARRSAQHQEIAGVVQGKGPPAAARRIRRYCAVS